MVITTPNVEYNVKFESLPAGKFRHKDHRFASLKAGARKRGREREGEDQDRAAILIHVPCDEAAVCSITRLKMSPALGNGFGVGDGRINRRCMLISFQTSKMFRLVRIASTWHGCRPA